MQNNSHHEEYNNSGRGLQETKKNNSVLHLLPYNTVTVGIANIHVYSSSEYCLLYMKQ